MKQPMIILNGMVAVLGWLVTFGVGLLVASQPYRDRLLEAFEWKAFFVSLLTYTPTNIAALCLLAAFCGGCASRLVLSSAATLQDRKDSAKSANSHAEVYMAESPVSSMLRGFVVYVAFLAGVYVGTNAPFAAPTQEQYARAAGTVSLVAFVVGYDPTLFRHLLSVGSKLKRD